MKRNDQLDLVDTGRSWRLDDKTREAGRRGVAQAREALRRAAARQDSGTVAGAPSRAA